MSIRRGTTPLLTITAEGVSLEESTVYVTIAQSDRKITKCNTDKTGTVDVEDLGENSIVKVMLSQAETLNLMPGPASVQLRWVEADGTAHASDIGRIKLDKTLLEGVIKYG